MNDAELDALARRASEQTCADARAVADSESALRQLLERAAADAPAPLAPVVPYHGPIRDAERRRRWQLVVVAAVIGVFALGIGFAIINGSSTIEIAGPPAGGTGTGPALGTTAPSASPPGSNGPGTSATATQPVASTPTTPEPTVAVSVGPAITGGTAPPATEPGRDPFEGWAAPALAPATLDALPYLLPADGRWDDTDVLRSEWESGETEATYTQVWVRTVRESTRVDAVLVLTSRLAPMPAVTGETVEIAGWPTATERPTADGVVTFDVASPIGSVTVWSLGLPRAEVITITSGLRADTVEGAGWNVVPVADEPWIEFDPGAWSVGFASRSVRVLGPTGATSGEITAVAGLPVGSVGPGFLGMELGLTDDDLPSLGFSDGTRSAVVTRRPDGITVSVGVAGSVEGALQIASRLGDVDRTTWEAATLPDPDFGDGCSGLFC